MKVSKRTTGILMLCGLFLISGCVAVHSIKAPFKPEEQRIKSGPNSLHGQAVITHRYIGSWGSSSTTSQSESSDYFLEDVPDEELSEDGREAKAVFGAVDSTLDLAETLDSDEEGTETSSGDSVLPEISTDTQTCEGKVKLVKATDYATERMNVLYGDTQHGFREPDEGKVFKPDPEQYKKSMRTTSLQSGGKFKFNGIESGEYYVIVQCDNYGTYKEGEILRKVSLSGGTGKTITVTKLNVHDRTSVPVTSTQPGFQTNDVPELGPEDVEIPEEEFEQDIQMPSSEDYSVPEVNTENNYESSPSFEDIQQNCGQSNVDCF
ncbi:MAG: hypothetical protein ABEJ65_06420 [bacterium]